MKRNQISFISIAAVLLLVLAGCEVPVDQERQDEIASQKQMSPEELCNKLSAQYKALDPRERVEFADKEVMQEACHMAQLAKGRSILGLDRPEEDKPRNVSDAWENTEEEEIDAIGNGNESD